MTQLHSGHTVTTSTHATHWTNRFQWDPHHTEQLEFFRGTPSLQVAFDTTPRADWLLTLLYILTPKHVPDWDRGRGVFALIACGFARSALLPLKDDSLQLTCKNAMAELSAWARGEAHSVQLIEHYHKVLLLMFRVLQQARGADWMDSAWDVNTKDMGEPREPRYLAVTAVASAMEAPIHTVCVRPAYEALKAALAATPKEERAAKNARAADFIRKTFADMQANRLGEARDGLQKR